MLILTVENEPLNTDQMQIGQEYHAGVLSFKDPDDPDFFFPVVEFLEEFTAASVVLSVGQFQLVMPLHWSILCTDMEYVHTIPLHELGGKQLPAFCLNPIDGFSPEFFRVRQGTIFPQASWTAPQLHDKDLLVVPLGDYSKPTQRGDRKRGPLCAMFSASKVEVYKPIGDIW